MIEPTWYPPTPGPRTLAEMRADAEATIARCAWETTAKKHARDVLALIRMVEANDAD